MIGKLVAKAIKEQLLVEIMNRPTSPKIDAEALDTVEAPYFIDILEHLIGHEQSKESIQNMDEEDHRMAAEYLHVHESERLSVCRESGERSNRIIDYLHNTSWAKFHDQLRSSNLQKLEDQLQESEANALTQHACKGTLVELLRNNMLDEEEWLEPVSGYLQAALNQLINQKGIFNQEVELGNRYSEVVKRVLSNHLDEVLKQVSQEDKKQIAILYSILVNKRIEPIDLHFINADSLNYELDQYREQLDVRSKELESIERVIHRLEKMVSELQSKVQTRHQSLKKTPHESTRPKHTPKPKPRMAFLQRFRKAIKRD